MGKMCCCKTAKRAINQAIDMLMPKARKFRSWCIIWIANAQISCTVSITGTLTPLKSKQSYPCRPHGRLLSGGLLDCWCICQMALCDKSHFLYG